MGALFLTHYIIDVLIVIKVYDYFPKRREVDQNHLDVDMKPWAGKFTLKLALDFNIKVIIKTQ